MLIVTLSKPRDFPEQTTNIMQPLFTQQIWRIQMEQTSITDYTLAACTVFTATFSLITLVNTIRRDSDDDYSEVHKLISDNKAGAQLRHHPINSLLNERLIRNWTNSKIARYYSPFGNILTSVAIFLLTAFLFTTLFLTIFFLLHAQYMGFLIGLALIVTLILVITIVLNSPSFSKKVTIERRIYIDYLSSIGIKQENPIQRLIPMFSRKHPASLYWNSLDLQSTIELLEEMRTFAKQQSLNEEWINKQIVESQKELDSKLDLLRTKHPEAFCALMFISSQKNLSDEPYQVTHTPKTRKHKINKK